MGGIRDARQTTTMLFLFGRFIRPLVSLTRSPSLSYSHESEAADDEEDRDEYEDRE